MNKPENTSTQEKIDAWFASLQLDKPAPLTKKERFFRWCIRNKSWLAPIAVFVLPIILYGILFVLERYTNLYWKYGFTKSEWFSFFGSYLGGVATFIGVVLTIRHTYKVHMRQEHILKIEKEGEALSHLMGKMNIPQFCVTKFHDFKALPIASPSQNIIHMQNILSSISQYKEDLNSELTRASLLCDIFSRELQCEKCQKQCDRYKLKLEFCNLFQKEIMRHIALIDELYKVIKFRFNIVNIYEIEKNNTNNLSKEECDKKIKEAEEDFNMSAKMTQDIEKELESIATEWHTSNLNKLIILIKFYKNEQIKNVNRQCNL